MLRCLSICMLLPVSNFIFLLTCYAKIITLPTYKIENIPIIDIHVIVNCVNYGRDCCLYSDEDPVVVCYTGSVHPDPPVPRSLVRITDAVHRGHCPGGAGLCGPHGTGGNGYTVYRFFCPVIFVLLL